MHRPVRAGRAVDWRRGGGCGPTAHRCLQPANAPAPRTDRAETAAPPCGEVGLRSGAQYRRHFHDGVVRTGQILPAPVGNLLFLAEHNDLLVG